MTQRSLWAPARSSFAWLVVGCVALFTATQANAYSYAAAGKEPVIDAREAILGKVTAGDFAGARAEARPIADELAYLDEHFGLDLASELGAAFDASDAARVTGVLDRAMAAEVERRLAGAAEDLANYQRAKVLVVKSKRFVDLLAPSLAPEPRASVNAAIRECLSAIGNPGIFGAGSRPADPEAFAKAAASIAHALDSLE